MVHRLYKHKLLLDENMPPRFTLPRLNGLFDVKHIRDDFNSGGLSDPQVYAFAAKLHRLIVTLNVRDFRALALNSYDTGIIGVSAHLPVYRIDTKVTALLVRSSAKALLGKVTIVTGETGTA